MKLSVRETQDRDTLIEVANKLNDMLAKDRHAINAIFLPVFVVKPSFIQSSAHVFEISPSRYAVNVLGIVSGTLDLTTDSHELGIDTNGNEIMGFKVINCKQDKQTNSGSTNDKT